MHFEVFCLEAQLFADMAILWNQTLESLAVLAMRDDPEEYKRCAAMGRATIRADFNFFEAYLNGIGASAHVLDLGLTEDKRGKLVEWDFERGRPRLLSLRDKLHQYTMLAAGKSLNVLPEEGCQESRHILQKERAMRHALIHPSPVLRAHDWKTSQLRSIDFRIEEIAELLDQIGALVRKIDGQLSPRFGDASLWLHERDPKSGRFPEATFM